MNEIKNKDEIAKSEKNKKENRRALKKFIPYMIAVALIGGIIGGISTLGGVSAAAAEIEMFLNTSFKFILPYLLIAVCLYGMTVPYLYWKKAKTRWADFEKETDEDKQDRIYQEADENISKAIFRGAASDIVSIVGIAALLCYIDEYIITDRLLCFSAIGIFIISNLARIVLQQWMIDLQKIMNPEKQGSVYELDFQKKWEDSCDELEKFIIYKSAYKAYKAGTKACVFAIVFTMFGGMFFDVGPLPSIVVGVIWGSILIAYYREAMKLEREKINL